ncbi:MAG: DUF853 domain-containing protein, partial [Candidatus Devosia euplotis]|nr:DUF853 domain-containing protein [Candidatus Devosia euplotis]
GNRVQRASRAYTPREQKAVRVAAETFRPNPAFSTQDVITQLGIGEALVSVLESKGVPSMVGRTMIRPPSAQVGPITPEERRAIVANSPVGELYDTAIDRDSAFETLSRKACDKQLAEELQQLEDKERKAAERTYQADRPARRSSRQTPAEEAMNSLARTVANRLGNALVRGILGSLKRG